MSALKKHSVKMSGVRVLIGLSGVEKKQNLEEGTHGRAECTETCVTIFLVGLVGV